MFKNLQRSSQHVHMGPRWGFAWATGHGLDTGTSFQVLVGGGKIKIIVAEGDAAAAGGVARRRGGGGLGEGCPLPQENFC